MSASEKRRDQILALLRDRRPLSDFAVELIKKDFRDPKYDRKCARYEKAERIRKERREMIANGIPAEEASDRLAREIRAKGGRCSSGQALDKFLRRNSHPPRWPLLCDD
jgi:hypothetical protein